MQFGNRLPPGVRECDLCPAEKPARTYDECTAEQRERIDMKFLLAYSTELLEMVERGELSNCLDREGWNWWANVLETFRKNEAERMEE